MRQAGSVVAALLLAGGMLAERQQQQVELQAAIRQETVDGDLQGAIKRYAAIAAKYARSDRAVTATALVHMAECYQKMGDAESRKIYERVVKDYGDQKEAVTLARARLGREFTASHSLALRQIWRLPANAEVDGICSRDGRYIPYVDWGRHGDLYLHDLLTGQDRQLTNTATDRMPQPKVEQFAEEFSVSPDGKQVAYSWFRGDHKNHYELRLVDLRGERITEPRLLFDNPDIDWISPDDWSPDGKWISVRITRIDKTAQVGLLSVSDGSLRILKSVDWRGSGKIFFSPDGKYLGYDLPQSDASQQRDVFVLAVDGGVETRVVAHRSHDTMMGWTPDGQRLLFASDRTGSVDLWSLPFASGKVQGEPELIKSDLGRAEPVVLTRSGVLYLSVSTGSQQQSHLQVAGFDFHTGKVVSPSIDVTPDYLESNDSPNWSVDGRYLGYFATRRRGSANMTLVIRSGDNRDLVRELPVKMNRINSNRWAPDGRSMMLWGVDLKGRWGFFQMDLQSGEISQMVLGPRHEISYPLWSVDGKSIYFTRQVNKGEQALVLRELQSGNEREVLRRAGIVAEPISPDRRYMVASSSDSTGAFVKLLIPVAGGEPRELVRIPADSDHPRLNGVQWAPDSRSFFTWKFFNDNKRTVEAWRVPVDGSAPVKLDLGGITFFKLRPDGKEIIFPVTEKGGPRGQEIWALENFLPPVTSAKR
jgi:Tol biopolymer transport system component